MKKSFTQRILICLLMICFSASSVLAASLPSSLSSNWVYDKNGKNIANIRKIAKFEATGYNVLQGSCNDGNGNFYFAFMNKSNSLIKIAKMRYENGVFVLEKKSAKLNVYHGNDMAYIPNAGGISGNDKIIITNHEDSFMNHLKVFDVASMTIEGELVSKYWKNYGDCKLYVGGKLIDQNTTIEYDESGNAIEVDPDYYLEDYMEAHGFSNLAYNKNTGKLVAALTTVHDIMIFDLTYSNGKFTMTPTAYIDQSRKESTIQGIDCDSDYIYMTWSPGNGVSGNRLYVYNWSGKKEKTYTIDNTYEIESISHIGSTFYAGYHHSYIYNWTTKTKKKVKLKKGKYKIKTVKVKHSELRRNGYIKEIKMAS